MASGLRARLASYPKYDLPHPGPGASLSREAAEANLARLLAQREVRLGAVATLLEACGLDPALAFADDPHSFLASLWQWTDET